MPLQVIEIRDLRAFSQAYADSVINKDIAQDVSSGFNFLPPMGQWQGAYYNHAAYDHIRDRLTYQIFGEKELPGGATAVDPGVVTFDAIGRNETIGWYRPATFYAGTIRSPYSGQPNLQTGAQNIYSWTGTDDHVILNPTDGSLDSTDVFPNITNDFNSGPIASGTAGYWVDFSSVDAGWNVIIFEGITDSTGMTEIDRGGSTHAEGLGLMHVGAINLDGGSNLSDRWAWIDMDTGEAVGVWDVPTRADTSSTLTGAEPSIAGYSFLWQRVQFVPDEGSTFAAPKGEIHVFSVNNNTAGYDIAGQTITAPSQEFTAQVERSFVTVYDFNPFAIDAGTVRVHNRRIFLGTIDTPVDPIIESGRTLASATSANDNFSTRSRNVFYHPPSRTYVNHQGSSEFANSEGADDPRVGDSRIIRWRRSTTVAAIGQPVPETAVTESRTIRARVDAINDVGERAVSAPVVFELFKVSTRDEQFNGTTQASSNYVVDQGEIDDDGYLEVYEGGGIDSGGTLLVETTDYTVSSYATGTLAPVGSWPTDTISVRYRHRNVRVGTGHGTLLTGSTITDVSGIAFARITYGADLEGELDELEATA